tara:strand:- start:3490 stop:5097 length:1608 start_codon:yes stop_codon:yes gene_type:complete
MNNTSYIDDDNVYHLAKSLKPALTLTNLIVNPTKVVYETIEQHKYSRLAYASYEFGNPEAVERLFSMKELASFELDKLLSTPEHSIFHDAFNNETVIAFRGSQRMKDVGTDMLIFMSLESVSQRFRQSLQVTKQVIDSYPASKVVTCGHSLGSGLSIVASNKYNLESHNFNSAESLLTAMKMKNEKVYNYRTHFDAVSVANTVERNKSVTTVLPKIGNEKNIETAHRLNNFFDDDAQRVTNNGREMMRSEKSSVIRTGGVFIAEALGIALGAYDLYKGIKRKQPVSNTFENVIDDVSPLPIKPLINHDSFTPYERFLANLAGSVEGNEASQNDMAEMFNNPDERPLTGFEESVVYMSRTPDESVDFVQVFGDGIQSTPVQSSVREEHRTDVRLLKRREVNDNRAHYHKFPIRRPPPPQFDSHVVLQKKMKFALQRRPLDPQTDRSDYLQLPLRRPRPPQFDSHVVQQKRLKLDDPDFVYPVERHSRRKSQFDAVQRKRSKPNPVEKRKETNFIDTPMATHVTKRTRMRERRMNNE